MVVLREYMMYIAYTHTTKHDYNIIYIHSLTLLLEKKWEIKWALPMF
jgi:hypothetical protein